jgi:arylsulfatase A-like enzyme
MIGALLLAAALQASRPNIVLIFTDDHATQAISAYGSKINRTPAIDALARRGVRFDRFYTTNPICAPSRASLLTGKYSHINGHRDNRTRFDGGQPTLPKLLHPAGYTTALIGKWHLESEPEGFDHWEILPGQGSYYNPDFITKDGRHREPGYVTDIVTEKSLAWLDRHPKDKPFLLMVQHKAPHRNWEPAPRHYSLYKDQTIPEPSDLFRDYKGLNSGAEKCLMQIGRDMIPRTDLKIGYTPSRMDEDQKKLWDAAYRPQDEAFERQHPMGIARTRAYYQRYIKDYLRCIAAVDDSVGRITEHLKKSELDKNTVVIYCSDQGFFLGEFGWYDKRWFYEPSSRTPLIVSWPGVGKAGMASNRLAANVDILPTLLEIAGATIPADVQGVSLAPLVRNPASKQVRQGVYGHFYESDDPDHKAPKYVALRTERYKVIFYEDLGEWELFDLKNDPKEHRNLAREPRHRGLLKQQADLLVREQVSLQESPDILQRTRHAVSRL